MRKISVIIANRHQTSICLEEEFLSALKKIAQEKNISINALVTEIDNNRTKNNLSSAIRVYILQYMTNAIA
ncbi:MAG: aryl-sulfate sulfotransferase [Alphaproteobacteria bacterium]|nr:aryl-sulfate sulfotransferase [Alphaproteobacteria bacterium]